ncbi:MAG TPA: DsbA family oxidoreductase [Vicinamibacterales bacterium]|nr:DsbA family oxidoreductase [Vicinamibacterales bacterium]
MHIDIWSDIVCPWCYLGKRRFERALEGFERRDEVRVTHRSFQLDPAKPRGTTSSRRTMLMSKYRLSDDQVRTMDARMEQTAAADGLEYHLTDAGLTGNTLDAHQLVHLANSLGRADAMIERLYRAYFTEQRSVFDHASLVDLAAEAGVGADEARQALERDLFVDAVTRDLNEARSLGITGVPFFVFDGRLGVSGAQAIEVFTQALASLIPQKSTVTFQRTNRGV